MTKYPIMPMHVDAYLGATEHLSTIEHGAYQLILMQMWRGGGVLPNDDKVLARCAKVDAARWKKMKPTIMGFIRIEGKFITQRRLIGILDKLNRHSESQSTKAQRRWLKNKGLPHADGIATALPVHMPTDAKVLSGESSLEGSALSPPENGKREKPVPGSGVERDEHGRLVKIEVSEAFKQTRLAKP